MPAAAAIPEPYNLVFGLIEMDGRQVTASDTSVVVEARRLPTAGTIARYVMGSQASAGDYYSLKIRLESQGLSDMMTAANTGTPLYITVLANGMIKDQLEYDMGERGAVKRLDFGNIDTDNDGLPDGWEQAYLYGLQYGLGDDPDHDGLTNADEYRLGANPLRWDARHPADVDMDWHVTIAELANYYNAWRRGQPWTMPPTNIPPDEVVTYVTRATYIWEQGGAYNFDTSILTAPLWWVPGAPPTNRVGLAAAGGAPTGQSTKRAVAKAGAGGAEAAEPMQAITSSRPYYRPGEVLYITNTVLIGSNARTYAVQHAPPAGWEIVEVVDGKYDAQNQRAKWGPFLDRQSRELVYGVRPPANAVGAQPLDGVASYDGYKVALQGLKGLVELPRTTDQMVLLPAGSPDQWLLVGQAGQSYTFEASTDLQTWTLAATAVADASGIVSFRDPAGGSAPARFYRAKLAAQ